MSQDGGGTLHTLTEKSVSATHPEIQEEPLLVGASTATEFNTLRARLIPRGCFKLEDSHFAFDSSFVLPLDQTFDAGPLKALMDKHPGAKLSIFGHADPVGQDTYNKTLSGRRAQVIFGMLIREVTLWEDLYYNHDSNGKDEWGVRPVQFMLTQVGFPTGRTDGVLDDPTKKALGDFQTANGLPQKGFDSKKEIDRATFKKLAALYMDAICTDDDGKQFKLTKDDFLARGQGKSGKGDFQGCGEFNPLMIFSKEEKIFFDKKENKPQRNQENQINRRVMVLLFRAGSRVDPEKWPCPSAKEGTAGCEKRFFSDGATRRSNQALRREFKDTKDTFACRFYDRISNGSPCDDFVPPIPVERLEFHPVRPVPPDATLPPRPPLAPGAPPPVLNAGGAAVTPDSPINVIANPAVIPILASSAATKDTAARLEFTFLQPSTLAFTDDDPRLTWSIESLDGKGAVEFVGPKAGLKVLVFGTAAGEVRLNVSFVGKVVAQYRALVSAVKQIPCRFNILKDQNDLTKPRSTPANILDHLAIANRFLRQLALELVLDQDTSVKDGAVATSVLGIFTITVATGVTKNISNTGFPQATLLNFRPNVMNFAYIISVAGGGILGVATDFPANKLGTSVTDNGSPSSSWNLPAGVPPGTNVAPVTMKIIAARQRGGQPQLFAMHITELNGDPSQLAAQQSYGRVIAHELGHVLNLGHRVEGTQPVTPANPTGLNANGVFFDGLTHPPLENVMNFAPGGSAQDLDILQARVVHNSPLVPA